MKHTKKKKKGSRSKSSRSTNKQRKRQGSPAQKSNAPVKSRKVSVPPRLTEPDAPARGNKGIAAEAEPKHIHRVSGANAVHQQVATKICVAIAFAGLFCSVIILLYLIFRTDTSPVKPLVTLECGQPLPDASAFLTDNRMAKRASITIEPSVDVNRPGLYSVQVNVGRRDYFSVLNISDTIAPSVVAKNIVVLAGEFITPDMLIDSFYDVSPVLFSWTTPMAFSAPGIHSAEVSVTDIYGNNTDVIAEVTILPGVTYCRVPVGVEPEFIFDTEGYDIELPSIPDEQKSTPGLHSLTIGIGGRQIAVTMEVIDISPPVFSGVADRSVTVGGQVSYRENVTITDDVDTNLRFDVNADAVKLDTPGYYPVIYSAVDSAGNAVEATAYITVKAKNAVRYTTDPVNAAVNLNDVTEEDAYKIADEVVASLSLDGLSTREKINKIHKWVTSHLSYIHDADNIVEWKCFYRTYKTKKADCYAYYATYQVLLTRAGIENLHITRTGGTSNHHWNLVNVDGMWYHSDTTPFARFTGDRRIFTESYARQITEQRGNNCYVYDYSLYPEVTWE